MPVMLFMLEDYGMWHVDSGIYVSIKSASTVSCDVIPRRIEHHIKQLHKYIFEVLQTVTVLLHLHMNFWHI